MTRPSRCARYGGPVTWLRAFLAARGVDALIVIVALAGAVGTLARPARDRPDNDLLVGLEAAAVAVMILGLLLRHRAPFVAPAGTWLVSAGLSFLDGRLIVGQAAISIAGMLAAILLGNVREERKARAGLMVVVVCAVTIIYNDPTHSVGSLFFVPVLFAVGWLVGFALHERAEQTEAAEQRAARAERERENAAGSPSPRNALASPGSSTTSSPMPSASWCSRSERYAIGCRRVRRTERPCTTSNTPAGPPSPRCGDSWGRCAATTTSWISPRNPAWTCSRP